VLVNVAHGGARQRHGGRDRAQVFAHQHDVGSFDGDVRTGTDSEPYVCRRQGWGVVDAVAAECDIPVPSTQLVDGRDLAVGYHVRHHLIDAHLLGHRARSAFLVAANHDHPYVERVRTTNALGGV